jgi:hypothetical protein
MAKMSRARLLEALHYAERFIPAGAEALDNQRQFVRRLNAEGQGDSDMALAARTLLAQMEQAQRGHVADR